MGSNNSSTLHGNNFLSHNLRLNANTNYLGKDLGLFGGKWSSQFKNSVKMFKLWLKQFTSGFERISYIFYGLFHYLNTKTGLPVRRKDNEAGIQYSNI